MQFKNIDIMYVVRKLFNITYIILFSIVKIIM